MSALSVPNTFAAGNTILSAGVNANFAAVVAWAAGNIDNTNFGTMSGVITWTVTTNVLAQNIANSGTAGSIVISHTGVLAAAKSILDISSSSAQTTGTAGFALTFSSAASTIPLALFTHAGTGTLLHLSYTGVLASGKAAIVMNASGAQTTGVAGMYLEFGSASSTIPLAYLYNAGTGHGIRLTQNGSLAAGKAGVQVEVDGTQTAGQAGLHVSVTSALSSIPGIQINYAGAAAGAKVLDVVSTTAAAVPAPKMSTAQKAALSSPPAGSLVYDTTLDRLDAYTNSQWRRVGDKKNVVSKTTTYTTTAADDQVNCDATGAAFTVTLIAAASVAGKKVVFKKTDSSANVVTIDANGAETIDGALTFKLHIQYEAVELISDGTNWHVSAYVPVSGRYTPTLTSVANVGASTARSCFFSKNKNIVTVFGTLELDPTSAATNTELGISLPIASDLADSRDVAGIATNDDDSTRGFVLGDASNNRAQLTMIPASANNAPVRFSFQYEIL